MIAIHHVMKKEGDDEDHVFVKQTATAWGENLSIEIFWSKCR
jgi:hypothetical protein